MKYNVPFAIQIYSSTSAPSKFTWQSSSILSEPNALRTQPFRTWQHRRFSLGRTQQALLQHQSLTAPLVSGEKMSTTVTKLIWSSECTLVCERQSVRVPHRRTQQIHGNEGNCWQLCEVWADIFHLSKPEPRRIIRAWCCETIRFAS